MKSLFSMFLPRNKKGYQVSDIAPIAIMLGLAIVATVVIAQVVTQVQTDTVANSYARNISNDGLAGLGELGSWFDTIGLVIAAAIIIGILVYAFAFKK